MPTAPRIAILLDENTSVDGTRYEVNKAYFRAVRDAGGLPYGIPYIDELIAPTLNDFGGFVAVGGGFAYPDEWYLPGTRSPYKQSERLAFERTLMQGFLDRGKPVLGICAGMQMLACLHGARLNGDVQAPVPGALTVALPHYSRDETHPVTLVVGTALHAAVGTETLAVNSFHREAVGEVPTRVRVAAYATDGVIEAIEIPEHAFAIGLQWHQERYAETSHRGLRIFSTFITAARTTPVRSK